ncbi:MAG: carbohydrate-binding domain-containing protein [Spirochaetales bacterium]|nr:carbohydrate-binding domain-containing protein [Spirochaetales bacterium]
MFIQCLKKEKALRIFILILLTGLFCPLIAWSQTLGDVDSSGSVDILDALLTAQYYVGFNPANFQTIYADVDGNGDIDIIDALLMAQYYVGLITEFPAGTPAATPEATPAMTEAPAGDADIVLNGNSITVSGSGATVNGSIVTITAGGTYNIRGTLNDGRILVDTPDALLVTLNLNGIDIYSSVNSPLSIMNASEGVEIVLGENTQNFITDSSSYVFEDPGVDEPNAALFADTDLDIIGTGMLVVEANYNDGIACKDDMNIKECTIIVTSVDDGLRGKNSLEIKSGANITVNSAGDCLKSDDAEDGLIEIKKCTVDLTSTGADGMDAEIQVTVTNEDAVVDITAGGGSNVTPNDSVSTKGIKGVGNVLIELGNIKINSSDDAIHSNNSITISGGTLTLATGDDGVHADLTLDINDGDINVTKSYEGIESETLTINNGTIHVTADDDGINAASSTGTMPGMPGNPGNYYLNINGGYIAVNITDVTAPGSTGGDGLDCNGYITMTGGTVIIHSNSNNVDSAIDYDGSFTMNGGFIVGAGTSNMSMAPGGDSSTQNSLVYNFSAQQTGSLVNIQSSNGVSILTFAPNKQYSSIAFSSPDLVTGTTYNVYFGGSATGTILDGLYQNATYNPGSPGTSFTVSSRVTSIGASQWPRGQ